MKRMTKAQSERVHAKRRCMERYGLEINRHDIRDIVGMIQSGDRTKATKKEDQSQRVSVWIVKFRGIDVKVVYDRVRKTLVSFLPMEDKKEWPDYQVEP